MHSVLSNKTCVRLLKCVYYGLNRNQTGYAYRKLRLCSNHNVLATTAIQETTSNLAGLWPYCAYSGAPCWSKTTCRNSSDEEQMMELMTVNLKLNFNC